MIGPGNSASSRSRPSLPSTAHHEARVRSAKLFTPKWTTTFFSTHTEIKINHCHSCANVPHLKIACGSVCTSVRVCVTGHRNGQQLQDPEVEPHLNQNDGPGQQDEVDVAGSLGASLFLEDASWEGAGAPREAGRGGQRPQTGHPVFRETRAGRRTGFSRDFGSFSNTHICRFMTHITAHSRSLMFLNIKHLVIF